MNALRAHAKPRLPRGVRLRFDPVRDTWVLLAPERVLFPDTVALAVLEACDGARALDEIVSELAGRFEAPHETIRADVCELLQELADKGFVEV